jgi:MOSC domain-containing protein YiiM
MGRPRMQGRVFSINVNSVKGEPKNMVASGVLVENRGLEGDAHAGPGLRQVSLLAIEDIEDAEAASGECGVDFRPGIFAENITTEHVDLSALRVGDRIALGDEAIINITQIGKDCHGLCSVAQKAGRCIMPKQGIFATVEKSGTVRVHDVIRIVKNKAKKWNTFFHV